MNKERTFKPWEKYIDARKDYPPWMFLSRETYVGLIEELKKAYERIDALEAKYSAQHSEYYELVKETS